MKIRHTILVSTALAAVGVGSIAKAEATSPPHRLPEAIAFSAGQGARGRPYRVFVARRDGTVVQVTHGSGGRLVPGAIAWSPDGSHVLVTSDDGIYVVGADGKGETRVAGLTNLYAEVNWAPDGRRIAFQQGNAIYAVDADGSGGLRLLAPDASNSWNDWSWSPDGTRIAYIGGPENSKLGLYLVNTSGAPRPVRVRLRPSPGAGRGDAVTPTAPSWSPDGSHIAFACCPVGNELNNQVEVTNPNGTGTHRVGLGWIEGWSPDGRSLVIAPGFNVIYKLIVVRADGTGAHTLPACSGGPGRSVNGCGWVTWLPDGKHILYTQGPNLYAINADGSGRRLIAHTHSRFARFAASPDGSTIVYVDGKGPDYNRNLYIVGVDGSGRRLVAHSSTLRYWNPTWQPKIPVRLAAPARTDS